VGGAGPFGRKQRFHAASGTMGGPGEFAIIEIGWRRHRFVLGPVHSIGRVLVDARGVAAADLSPATHPTMGRVSMKAFWVGLPGAM
jgi:hypothetical protein